MFEIFATRYVHLAVVNRHLSCDKISVTLSRKKTYLARKIDFQKLSFFFWKFLKKSIFSGKSKFSGKSWKIKKNENFEISKICFFFFRKFFLQIFFSKIKFHHEKIIFFFQIFFLTRYDHLVSKTNTQITLIAIQRDTGRRFRFFGENYSYFPSIWHICYL